MPLTAANMNKIKDERSHFGQMIEWLLLCTRIANKVIKTSSM
jgi:hypothetical protein